MHDRECAPELTLERTLDLPILTKATRPAWCSHHGLAIMLRLVYFIRIWHTLIRPPAFGPSQRAPASISASTHHYGHMPVAP